MVDRQQRELQTALEEPRTWHRIAAATWQAYQQAGAGCLLLHDFPPKAIEYVSRTEGQAFLRTNGVDIWVNAYDPTKEVIVCVLLAAVDRVSCYRLSQVPYPAQIHK